MHEWFFKSMSWGRCVKSKICKSSNNDQEISALFFPSYFVGMCGDGANDCGVCKLTVVVKIEAA